MSYFPNIPAATDNPSVSQGDIQTNFGTINSSFNLNHVSLGSGLGTAGKHNFVEMPNQVSTPATISGEGTLYTKSATGSQLFYVADNQPTDLYQLTRTIHASYSRFGTNTNYSGSLNGGWTFLPGGMLLQYGLASSITAPGTGVVLFPVTFTTGVFTLSITPIRNSSNVDIVYASATAGLASFSYRNTASGISQFYWMAIGI